jgi:hypothetical protein
MYVGKYVLVYLPVAVGAVSSKLGQPVPTARALQLCRSQCTHIKYG